MQMEGSYVLAVVLTGLIVVFIALVVLIAFVWLMGKIFESINSSKGKKKGDGKKTEAAPVKAVQPAAPAMDIEEGISDEIVAVIAAAVASMSGNFAIKSVRKASPKTSRRSAWGTQGIAESTRVF
ncbi:MAG: OadG family transporter subunit [Oscillospiraceae bacterium]